LVVTNAKTDALSTRSPWRFLLAILIYLGLIAIIFRLDEHNILRQIIDPGSDPNIFLFFLKWWPYALTHHHDPFQVTSLTHPYTYNAAWMTSIPALALLTAPVTYFFGPIASWNILVLGALFLSSFTMFSLTWIITYDLLGALVSGLIFGFSTYQFAELVHINLIFAFPLPLIGLLLTQLHRGVLSKHWFIVITAMTLAFLAYTSTELLLTCTVSISLFILILLVWDRRVFLNLLQPYYHEIIPTLLTAGILTSPLIWYIVRGITVASSSINSPTTYSTDIVNLVVPTQVTALGGNIFAPISAHFSGNATEQSAYIGVVLLGLTSVSLIRESKKSRWVRPIGLAMLVILILSLGPRLHVAGTVTGIPLPWAVFSRLPFLDNVLPARLMLYVWLLLALWIGIWLSLSIGWRTRLIRGVLVLVGITILLPAASDIYWVRPPLSFTGSHKLSVLRSLSGGVVRLPGSPASLPFQDSYLTALLSLASNFHLSATTVPWSYNVYPHDNQLNQWPIELSAGPTNLKPDVAEQVAAFVDAYRDRYVAIYTGNHRWRAQLALLGWKHFRVGSILVYQVPQALLHKYEHYGLTHASVDYYLNALEQIETSLTCYFGKGHPLGTLDPSTMVSAACASQRLVEQSDVTSNWTTNGIWVGTYSDEIAIGMQTTGKVAHAVFTHFPRSSTTYYFSPNPHKEHLWSLPELGKGTYLILLSKKSLKN
jgi:hypothetical protein